MFPERNCIVMGAQGVWHAGRRRRGLKFQAKTTPNFLKIDVLAIFSSIGFNKTLKTNDPVWLKVKQRMARMEIDRLENVGKTFKPCSCFLCVSKKSVKVNLITVCSVVKNSLDISQEAQA